MAEANRMPSGSRKLADTIKAGHRETFATHRGPASEPAMRRETEPMVEAPADITPRQRESGRGGRKAGGEPDRIWLMRSRGEPAMANQQLTQSAVVGCQTPHGVKSVSKAGKRSLAEPKNFLVASNPGGIWKTEAIGIARRKDGAFVVVGERESRSHGEGRQ